MKKLKRIAKNARCESYLIGDSIQFGKDQVLSRTIKYNDKGLYDEQNEAVIADAREYAARDNFNNIRIVTVWFDEVFVGGVTFGFRESKRKIENYRFPTC